MIFQPLCSAVGNHSHAITGNNYLMAAGTLIYAKPEYELCSLSITEYTLYRGTERLGIPGDLEAP